MSVTATTVPASTLKVLPETLFPRQAGSEEHVAALAEVLRGGRPLPPILVDSHNRVVDGWHRWQAHVTVYGEDAPVPCVVKKYKTDGELFLDAVRENAAHGLRFNGADTARCASIAKSLGVKAPALARTLSVSPAALVRAGAEAAVESEEESPLPPTRTNGPAARARESAGRLLELLGSGRLRQNATALEKDLRRLSSAIEGYLTRGEAEYKAGDPATEEA